MTVNIPTIQDIYDRMRQNYRTLSGGDPVGGDQSAAGMLMQSFAGAVFENYQYVEAVFRNGFVHLADAEALALHGVDFGVERNYGSQNTEIVVVFQRNFVSDNNFRIEIEGVKYAVDYNDFKFTYTGTETIPFPGTNLKVFPSSINDSLVITVNVVSFTPASDGESDEEYRQRILDRLHNPPLSGADHDYVRWAEEILFVKKAWVFGNEPDAGDVTVYCIIDGAPITNNTLAGIKKYIDERRPVTANVTVLAPSYVDIDLTIRSAANATTQAAVEDSLRDLFEREAAPGHNISDNEIISAINQVEGHTDFTLTFDNINVADNKHMLRLGTVTWETP